MCLRYGVCLAAQGIFLHDSSQTTIRVLGGLLSSFHLSNDSIFKEKAVDLADRLMVAFSTRSPLPTTMVNLGKRIPIPDSQNSFLVSTAEVATLQLEFRYLSQLTGDYKYWKAVEKVCVQVDSVLLAPFNAGYRL